MKTKGRTHIAIVVNSIEPGGGVSNVALAQAKALSQYFSISLLCAHGSLSHENIEVHNIAEPKLIWMRRFGHVVREYFLCKRFAVALCAIDKFKSLDFVLFHSHTAAAMATSKLGSSVPFGMVIHGDIFSRPKGSYDPLLTWFYKYSSKHAYRVIDLIIALSPSMRIKAIEYGADNRRVVVIPNGIEISDIDCQEEGIKNRKDIKLVFVGRLSVEKAPLVLLNALAMIDSSICLSIAGNGPLEPTIREFVLAHDLQDRVELLGHMTSAEINDLYINSDILCVPSINDPLPTVILEAMNVGLPVIGSDVDGIPFMIKHNVSGFLVSPGEPRALAEAITKLAESSELRTEVAYAAKQRVSQKFSLTAVTKQLVTSIEKTIKGA